MFVHSSPNFPRSFSSRLTTSEAATSQAHQEQARLTPPSTPSSQRSSTSSTPRAPRSTSTHPGTQQNLHLSQRRRCRRSSRRYTQTSSRSTRSRSLRIHSSPTTALRTEAARPSSTPRRSRGGHMAVRCPRAGRTRRLRTRQSSWTGCQVRSSRQTLQLVRTRFSCTLRAWGERTTETNTSGTRKGVKVFESRTSP